MAKDFAIRFYNSKKWKDIRNAYFQYRYGLCELCERPGQEVHHKIHLTATNMNDNNITSNWENLQLLCRTCHGEEHEKAYNMRKSKYRKIRNTRQDTEFDSEGNLVENKSVKIVWGAPASGKTTYVKENKGEYDIVIDLDAINAALSLMTGKDRTDDALPYAIDVRDCLYGLIAERKHYFEKCWVVVALPELKERLALAKKLNAELIHIDADKETCRQRAMEDNERRDKQQQVRLIARYFDALTI